MNKLENAITELDAILLDLQNLRKAKAGDVGRAQGRALAARAVIVDAARGAHWRRWDELTLERAGFGRSATCTVNAREYLRYVPLRLYRRHRRARLLEHGEESLHSSLGAKHVPHRLCDST